MSRTIERLAAAVTGPRGRWLAIAVWIPLGIAGYFAHAHIGDVTAAGQSTFLPSNSESTGPSTRSSTATGAARRSRS